MATYAVVGAGLAGLAAAHRLRSDGHRVTVFEAAERPGGVIGSVRHDGFLAETGAHSFGPPPPEAAALLTALGLGPEILAPASEARNRFVLHEGRLAPLPASPPALLRSPLLPLRARASVLLEPLRRAPAPPADESIASLVRRRGLDTALIDRMLDPFVGGVYAGDPERLSARWAFPSLHGLVRDHGSLVRGAVASARARRDTPPGPSGSFAGGMTRVIDALTRGIDLRLNEEVLDIRPVVGDGWHVLTHTGSTAADGIVCAVPAHRLATLLAPALRAANLGLPAVPHAPVAVLTLGFERESIDHPLDGFGALFRRSAGLRLLGVLFPSSCFPDRAPAGHVTLACFLGGTRDPDAAALDPENATRLAIAELTPLLGIHGPPRFQHLARWPLGIPQYEVGFGETIAAFDRVEHALPGLVLCGSYRGEGVAVGQVLDSGLHAAARLCVARDASGGGPHAGRSPD